MSVSSSRTTVASRRQFSSSLRRSATVGRGPGRGVAGVMISCIGTSLLALGLTTRAAADQPPAPSEVELRRNTQELLAAIAPGEVAVWRRYLHDDFVHMDENGMVLGKQELLKELTPLPAGLVGRIEVDRFQTHIHGNTAVIAYEMQEYLDYHGQPLRTRFRALDTWLATPAGWRLIGQHTAAVLKDPPAVRLTGQELCAYEGVYSLTPTIKTTIRCQDDGLASERGDRPVARYSAEVRDVFFVAGQPRTRRIFTRDPSGRVVGFVDRREGEDVRWTKAETRADTETAGAPGVEDTVKALDTEYQRAVLRRDLKTMDRILADDFVLITGRGARYSKAEVMAEVASPELSYERQEPSQQTVRVWGETAVVTALLLAQGTKQGKPFEYRLWYSDTYVRKAVGWRYVLGQAAQPLSP
jgi:ketosteroid isomerase-like protein